MSGTHLIETDDGRIGICDYCSRPTCGQGFDEDRACQCAERAEDAPTSVYSVIAHGRHSSTIRVRSFDATSIEEAATIMERVCAGEFDYLEIEVFTHTPSGDWQAEATFDDRVKQALGQPNASEAE